MEVQYMTGDKREAELKKQTRDNIRKEMHLLGLIIQFLFNLAESCPFHPYWLSLTQL